MKEFGVYTITSNYISDFLGTENRLAQPKILRRPFICVKIRNNNIETNWLVPLTSINPQKDNEYESRIVKHNAFNRLDKRSYPHAMDIFDDLLHLDIKGYKNVAEYYNAIPVKHKYCRKYKNKQGQHIVIERSNGTKIRQKLKDYLVARKQGNQYVGFLGILVRQGRKNFESYPLDHEKLEKAIYKKRNALLQQRQKHKEEVDIRLQQQQHKHELKKQYKALNGDELLAATIDQCGQKIDAEIKSEQTKTTQKGSQQQAGNTVRQEQQVGQVRQAQPVASKGKGKKKNSGKG